MKMTQKDKVLLILLGLIVVVALVVVMPGFGVMACNDKIKESATASSEVDEELTAALTELREMGVEAALADNFRLAKDRLEKKIMDQKEEASRLAHSIMAFAESFDVDEQWIYGLEYKKGIASDEESLLITYDKFSDVERSPNTDEEYEIKETIYTLKSADRSIQYTISEYAECYLNYQMILEGYDVNEIAAFLIYIQQITSKGSILINEATYDAVGKTGQVSFTALMTATDGISRYAQEIAEALEAQANNTEE